MPGSFRPRWRGPGVVVDAIFGTGFAGEPRDPAAAAIDAINGCGAPVVAADIASGVNASSGEVEGAAVEADLTVSFHAPKLGHWIAPGKRHTGELRVVPIGIPDGAPEGAAAGLIDERGAGRAAPARRRDRPSSARARSWWSAVRAGSPAPSAFPRRPRSAPGPATRPSPCPPTWSTSSR